MTVDLLVAPVGDDAAAPRRARADHPAGAGWIDAKRDRHQRRSPVDSPIKAHHATFADKNGNFQADPGEERRAWELAATAVKKDARVFVLADSDLLRRRGAAGRRQQLLALDVIALADGRRGVHRADLDRGGRAHLAHPQAGRGLVLLDDLPGARAGASAGSA